MGEEIKDLPGQYLEVLTKPGAAAFAAQMGKASWLMVWVQLLGWGIIPTDPLYWDCAFCIMN